MLMQNEPATALSAGQQRYLKLIESSAHSMNELIGGLLSLARVSRQPLIAGPLDLSAMARRILGRLAFVDPDRQVEWAVPDLRRRASLKPASALVAPRHKGQRSQAGGHQRVGLGFRDRRGHHIVQTLGRLGGRGGLVVGGQRNDAVAGIGSHLQK